MWHPEVRTRKFSDFGFRFEWKPNTKPKPKPEKSKFKATRKIQLCFLLVF